MRVTGVENIQEPVIKEDITPLPSHKFQCRIGRLDRGLKWVDEVQWEAKRKDSRGTSGKELKFAIKIINSGPPGPGSSAPTLSQIMIVLSPYIRKVFIKIVKFYPGVKIRSDSIEMTFPFAPLYHYFEAMQKFVQNDESEDASREDFEVLEWFHDKYLVSHYNEVRSFISLGNVTFEYLWAIFRPGDLIITRDQLGHRQLHVLAMAEMREKWSTTGFTAVGRTLKMVFVKAWSIVWSPSAQAFRRTLWVFAIPQFVGSKGITSLDVYPLDFEDIVFQETLKKELIERGKTWKKLVSQRPTCWHYKGAAFDGRAGGIRPYIQPGESPLLKTTNVS